MAVIRGNSNRVLQAHREPQRNFTHAKRKQFLGHFAATGNVSESARTAGVPLSTAYDRRRVDHAFRDAWALAEENAVITLRAEMVRRSLELLQAATPDEVALATLPGLDCRTIMVLLKMHEKGLGKGPGERRPQRSDPKEAAARLAKLLDRMRAEHKRELAVKRAAKAARAAGAAAV
nr:hypothetical protein [uncultured Sphingomonas sp.]